MHPQIADIGYHNRDYFLGQWERFKDEPWGDLAHSTHLRGQGTWSAENGERNRVTVTLATGIPEEVVRSVNLNYLNPPMSTSPRTRPIPTPSSNRTPARCSIDWAHHKPAIGSANPMDASQTSQDSRDDRARQDRHRRHGRCRVRARPPSLDCSLKTWAGSRPRRMIFTTQRASPRWRLGSR